jgi:hypothetical protein
MLMELIATENPGYSILQIENIICTPAECEIERYHQRLDEFLSYI